MKRCGILCAGLLLLGLGAPAQAGCLDGQGFAWIGCSTPEWPLRSGWTGSPATPDLEATVHLAEWRNDESANNRLRLRFDARSDTEDLLRRWRYGAGLDMELPGGGLLQASLSTSKRRRGEGARYALTPDGLSTQGRQPLWALGLSLAPEKGFDGSRRMLLAPQLRIDVDRLLDSHGNAELYVEYTPWLHDLRGTSRESREQLADELGDRVPQLRMRWRF